MSRADSCCFGWYVAQGEHKVQAALSAASAKPAFILDVSVRTTKKNRGSHASLFEYLRAGCPMHYGEHLQCSRTPYSAGSLLADDPRRYCGARQCISIRFSRP
jgi:hypothetical protein